MKNKIRLFAIIIGSVGLLSLGMVYRPAAAIIPDLAKKLENYYRRYPQQKAYLHLDKIAYQAGEKIWYMSYLVDARTHKPDTISKNLIVELVNSFGHVSLIQILKLERGYACGDFQLPDTLSEGLYQIRAYTNWMRNFGDEYFFRRDVNIWNPENYINTYREDKLANKKHKRQSSRKARKLDVQFFPEGGYLVGGINSRVGFKAVNDLGLGISVSGTLYDKKKKSIASFESSHLGMGAFSFIPIAGEKYSAEVIDPAGKKYQISLPEVESSGYSLQLLRNNRDGLTLRLESTFNRPTVMLACHVSGNLLYTNELQITTDGVNIDIPTRDFPGGIMQITLFDSDRKPRCERLAYIYSDDIIDISIRQDKSEYGKMEAVELTLLAKNSSGQPVEGRFSLSVSDRDLPNNAADFQSGIIASLLLSSDIAGRVEHADYYFRNQEAETMQNLDYLLLTQGWRRFSWEDVINESRRTIDYPIQKGLVITGRVTKELFDIPLKNIPVTLTVLSEFNDVFITRTNAQGNFEFLLPDYEDTIQVEITSRRLSGKKNLVIYINDNDMEEAEQIFSSYSSAMDIKGTNTLRPLMEEPVDSMQPITEGIYRSPDYVLYVDDHMRSQSSVLEMMQGRIPGVTVMGDNVQIRGPSSFQGNNQPLFLIDNVPSDIGSVQSLNPNDVERIEVLKGPSAAIYGVRGGNGVIAIFTRRGRYMIKGKITFDMLGYHKPKEFYSPKYGTGFDELVIDNRSSLYWNPAVYTNSNGIASIRFFNSDKISTFYVVVEGCTSNGKIGRSERSYQVKQGL